jgi:hypothetical protein
MSLEGLTRIDTDDTDLRTGNCRDDNSNCKNKDEIQVLRSSQDDDKKQSVTTGSEWVKE